MNEMLSEAKAAARALRMRLFFAAARSPDEFESAFAEINRARPDALLVFPSPTFFTERKRLVELAANHRLPAIFNTRQAAELGGLIGYGTNVLELVRRSATYVDRILKGARADLPVEQPTRFELVINMKTAKALGLTIAPSLLLRADHVIE
ncbi:MAG TPA: ABC transporter substrate-binding protein [Burkholderiaceae bacterium]|nr:ABC transporter substrate-binding protein [Burkholderiaceae bacterium]